MSGGVIYLRKQTATTKQHQALDLQQILSLLVEQLCTQTPLDWSITVTALVYVWLAARENAWCWVWGIVSCSLWAYADFFRYQLWADGVLQLFYVGMGAWGLYSWKLGGEQSADKSEKDLPIGTLPLKKHLILLGAGILLSLMLGYFFKNYTPAALPYPDSFITAFSILATLLTVRKILENWLYWIVLDTMAVFLFSARSAFLLALVMFIYALISVLGYISWRKKWMRSHSNLSRPFVRP